MPPGWQFPRLLAVSAPTIPSYFPGADCAFRRQAITLQPHFINIYCYCSLGSIFIPHCIIGFRIIISQYAIHATGLFYAGDFAFRPLPPLIIFAARSPGQFAILQYFPLSLLRYFLSGPERLFPFQRSRVIAHSVRPGYFHQAPGFARRALTLALNSGFPLRPLSPAAPPLLTTHGFAGPCRRRRHCRRPATLRHFCQALRRHWPPTRI